MIPTVPIFESKVELCRIGFGCGRLFGGSETSASTRLIEAALDAGIRHFDTAPSYGGGTSEYALGDVLRGLSDVTITTKVGIQPSPQSGSSRARIAYRAFFRPLLARTPALKSLLLSAASRKFAHPPARQTPTRRPLLRDEIMTSLDTSLKKLKRERVALYLVHDPDQFHLTAETAAIFDDLVRENLIGAYGLAFDRVALGELEFGSVLQSRAHVPAQPDRRTPIFHGLLRHGTGELKGLKSGPPEDTISRFLKVVRGSVIIFSASSPFQITSVMNKLRCRLS
jgi:Aldo/keto reductase family